MRSKLESQCWVQTAGNKPELKKIRWYSFRSSSPTAEKRKKKHTIWAAGKGRGGEKQEKEDKEEEEEEEREEGALLLKNVRLSPILPQRILSKP